MRAAAMAVTTPSPRREFPKSAADLNSSMMLMGTRIPYGPNEEIFGEGEPTQYIYKVISGWVRSYKVLDDGRRQIIGFRLPGQVFGLELTENHQFSAEAVNDTIILVVKRSAIMRLATHNVDIGRELWAITARELQCVQDHTLLLACMSAKARVAAFLLHMAPFGSNENEIELPMTREDIADYLAMTIETVSRAITQLRNDTAIEVPSRRGRRKSGGSDKAWPNTYRAGKLIADQRLRAK